MEGPSSCGPSIVLDCCGGRLVGLRWPIGAARHEEGLWTFSRSSTFPGSMRCAASHRRLIHCSFLVSFISFCSYDTKQIHFLTQITSTLFRHTDYISSSASVAFSSVPISISVTPEAILASSISTSFKRRLLGSSVVSHNCSASISPSPLYL